MAVLNTQIQFAVTLANVDCFLTGAKKKLEKQLKSTAGFFTGLRSTKEMKFYAVKQPT